MPNIHRKKRNQNDASKDQMRKKISFTKALTRIALCERELLTKCDDIQPSKISALSKVIDSNWKKIDKLLPNPQQIALEGEIIHRNADELTDSELADIAAGSSTGATEEADSSKVTH